MTVTWLTLLGFLASAVAALVIVSWLAVVACQYWRGAWRDDRRP